MPARIPTSEPRSFERVKDHYVIEKQLAARLRSANRNDRRHLYSELYDELFRRVPDHPQLTSKADAETRGVEVSERLNLLQPYLSAQTTYLELGPGDCALAIAVAQRVKKVYAVDVSREVSAGTVLPENMELVISDGCSVPVPDGLVDVAYSDQLMEHLHPDDAREQLENVYRALMPGGVYVCITPNQLSGPHDVSRYFDHLATGFHLREYTARELTSLFKEVGFSQCAALVGARGSHFAAPVALIKLIESLLTALPRGFGKTLARGLPLRLILGVKLVGTK
jgi:SAM-dependent methyltransferase